MLSNPQDQSTAQCTGTHTSDRYIDPSHHNFENCPPLRFVPQSCLRWPLAAWMAKGGQRDKSWKETIFKISAQQFNVYVCNVDCHLLVCKIRQPVNCLFRLPLPPKEAWYYVLFYCLRVKVDVLSASKKNSLPNNIQ